MPNKFNTREEWLNFVANELRPVYKAAGHPIPAKVRFAVGFCSTGERGNRIGECWYPEASGDKSVEIFIKPDQDDPITVAGILAHELVHAAVGPGHGHGRVFKKACTALGLEGKPAQMLPSEATYKTVLGLIVTKAGPLPHKKMTAFTNGKKKQTTRLLKAACEDCGYTVRVTSKWLEAAGAPYCGVRSHGRMICEEPEGDE